MEKKGRKNKYAEYVQPFLKDIAKWCEELTDKQIAEKLGIAYSTFSEYKKNFPELKEAIKGGRNRLVSELRASLIKKAKGYKYTETKIVTETARIPDELRGRMIEAGISTRELEAIKTVRREVTEKQYPPDVAAINLALKNYDPENWANDPQMLKIRKQQLELEKEKLKEQNW